MAPAPSSALEPSSGALPVGGLVAPCACCPCVLRGVRGFPARGEFATCLLLTGAPGFGSFSFSSAPLSLCSFLIQPSSIWGLFLVGCGVCLWCLRPSSCASLSFFVRRLFVSLQFLGGWRPVVALSRLRGGVQLFCFPWRPHVRSSSSVRGVGWSSWLSLLCLPPGSGSSSFHGSLWFWRGASASFHVGPTLGLSSAPWLFHRILPPVSSVLPLLDSSLLCSLASWLVLGSAFQVSWRRGLPPLPG